MTDTQMGAGRTATLNIKNPTTYELIRRLADQTGETMTQAVTVAVRERLERLEDRSTAEREQRRREVQELADSLAARFREPFASLDHGQGLFSDENGLPR